MFSVFQIRYNKNFYFYFYFRIINKKIILNLIKNKTNKKKNNDFLLSNKLILLLKLQNLKIIYILYFVFNPIFLT